MDIKISSTDCSDTSDRLQQNGFWNARGLQHKGRCRAPKVAQWERICQPVCRCRRQEFNPWFGKILWKRKWQPTAIFLLGEYMDRGTWWPIVHGVAQSDIPEWLSMHAQMNTHTLIHTQTHTHTHIGCYHPILVIPFALSSHFKMTVH